MLRRLPEVFATLEEMIATLSALNDTDPAAGHSTCEQSAANTPAGEAACTSSPNADSETLEHDLARIDRKRLPSFIVVGPPRTGTTWLHHALVGRVILPNGIKETDFFTNNYDLGLQWYVAHFKPRAGLAIGELAPTYFDSPQARQRIAHDLPGCRIICTLREPVTRAYSHYRILRREAWHGTAAFRETVLQHMTWNGPGNLLGGSAYAFHLAQWREAFGAENVMVALYDDLRADPQRYLDRICRFVGIAQFRLAPNNGSARNRNVIERAPRDPMLARYARELWNRMRRRRLYGPMRLLEPFWDYCLGCGPEFEALDPELAADLRRWLRPEIDALEQLIDRALPAWKQAS